MEASKETITVRTTVDAPIEKVWSYWSTPAHITKWNFVSDDWHAPKASNDLRIGGKFLFTMAAKDGSMSFDFEGEYTNVIENKKIEYVIADGRKVSIGFEDGDHGVAIAESFESENQNPIEMQRGGWQTILDNFKKYTEAN